MNERNLVADLPEHIWSAIRDMLMESPWAKTLTEATQPMSRSEALERYKEWYYRRYGSC